VRTTIVLDQDVVAAIDEMRRRRSLGLSEAVNDLIRTGLARQPATAPFRQRSRVMGARMDLTNVAEVLELLDGPAER